MQVCLLFVTKSSNDLDHYNHDNLMILPLLLSAVGKESLIPMVEMSLQSPLDDPDSYHEAIRKSL